MKGWIISLFLCCLIATCGGCSKPEETKPEKSPPVVEGRVEAVKAASVADFYEAAGTLRSPMVVTLSSRVMGYVRAVHVRQGDRVQPGQLLIEVDDQEINTQVRKAKAGLKEAQDFRDEVEGMIRAAESARVAAEANQKLAASTFIRYQALFERKSVSPQEFDEVKKENYQSRLARRAQVLAKIEQGRAGVAQMEVLLGYARLQSPLQGIVTEKHVEVGQLATPGMPLLTVEDESRYRLEAVVEESRVKNIRLGDSVPVLIDALGSREWAGKVAEIGPAVDPATRSTIVKVDLVLKGEKSLRREIHSGLFGKGRFAIGERQTILIPAPAIRQEGQLSKVFVVDSGNIAHMRLIQVGKSYGERLEVLAGIREGERIVTEGADRVQDGNQIKIQ
ncbi:MAG: efflux RND transporter periplasmic adaptor subunit [Deltaproteobacteria bacterium]|nr:efflux RND transporter periplasmic adaptor subunit [Deltaproteobacteria bacterium]